MVEIWRVNLERMITLVEVNYVPVALGVLDFWAHQADAGLLTVLEVLLARPLDVLFGYAEQLLLVGRPHVVVDLSDEPDHASRTRRLRCVLRLRAKI